MPGIKLVCGVMFVGHWPNKFDLDFICAWFPVVWSLEGSMYIIRHGVLPWTYVGYRDEMRPAILLYKTAEEDI